MKKLIYLFVMQLLIASLFTAGLSAQNYTANTDKTTVYWKGSKVVAGSHEGTINLKSGNVTFENDLITAGEVVIDMASIVDTDLEGGMKERLEGHLKSDDFFGVEKFPLAKFKVSKSESLDDDSIKVSGDLTIKGKTHPVSFVSSVENYGETLVFTGTMDVDRSLYDVRYGSGKFFDDLGDKAINDIFTLKFKLYLE